MKDYNAIIKGVVVKRNKWCIQKNVILIFREERECVLYHINEAKNVKKSVALSASVSMKAGSICISRL